jgi:hypothetical protein
MTCTLQTTTLAKKSVPPAQAPDTVHLSNERPDSPPKACPNGTNAECGTTPGVTCNAGAKVCVVAPPRLTCSIRQVGTFGAGAQGATFEVRSDVDMTGKNLVAEGKAGFNVPSLLSLSASAPYLHHGSAQTLDALFTSNDYKSHTQAGSANFAPTAQEVKDLVAFLLSIDQSTTTFPVDAQQDLCAPVITPNANATCTNP